MNRWDGNLSSLPSQKHKDDIEREKALAAAQTASNQLNSAKTQAGMDVKYINTGDTALDSQAYDQMMRDTQYLSTAKQLEQLGYNPAMMFGSVASAGGAGANATNATATKRELNIAQQNADAATTTAKASMVNAVANSAKAVSSFLPKWNFSNVTSKSTTNNLSKIFTTILNS